MLIVVRMGDHLAFRSVDETATTTAVTMVGSDVGLWEGRRVGDVGQLVAKTAVEMEPLTAATMASVLT